MNDRQTRCQTRQWACSAPVLPAWGLQEFQGCLGKGLRRKHMPGKLSLHRQRAQGSMPLCCPRGLSPGLHLLPAQPLLSCYCFLQAVPGAELPLLVRFAKSLLLCPSLCDPMDCSPPGSSVHGILQARVLEWVAMPSSRGSSCPRDRTASLTSPALAGRFFSTCHHSCHQSSTCFCC